MERLQLLISCGVENNSNRAPPDSGVVLLQSGSAREIHVLVLFVKDLGTQTQMVIEISDVDTKYITLFLS